MESDKKKLKREYRENPRPMGVFLIRNTVNDMVFVGAGLDLPGKINRHRFQLTMGNHPNRRLQADWNKHGSQSFTFEIFDQLSPQEDSQRDPREDIALLEQLCLEQLQPFGERCYNEPALTREDRLKRIAARRRADSDETGDERTDEDR